MKKNIPVLLYILIFTISGRAQTTTHNAKDELETMLSTYMSCITEKDSVQFTKLFYDGPVTWVGIFKPKSQQSRMQKDSTKVNNYFKGDYRSFIRSLLSKSNRFEQKFYHVKIQEDGCIAVITFDYSFHTDMKINNRGQESWSLIKANGKWKITSVIFSIELENNS